MLKLRKILTELLHTYSVEAFIKSNRKFSITDILNQIRAIRKITIVSVEDIPTNKPGIEHHLLRVKFVTRGEPKQDLEQIKKDILKSDLSKTDLRIPGVKQVEFKTDTLKRIE